MTTGRDRKKAAAGARAPRKQSVSPPPYRVRRSPIHGTGVFATRALRKGTRLGEYEGRHLSHEEADRLYADKATTDSHTFLFTLSSKTVIDANVGGNALRFINHACEPNCSAYIQDGGIFIETARSVSAGEELVYDYSIGRDPNDPPGIEQVYACRCGRPSCRGTMLEPLKKPSTKKRRRSRTKPRKR